MKKSIIVTALFVFNFDVGPFQLKPRGGDAEAVAEELVLAGRMIRMDLI